MTKNAQVVDLAVRDIGIEERPLGSNSDGGGPIDKLQHPWSMGAGTRIGPQPWCAMWVAKIWKQAGVSRDACSPSTAVMVAVARRLGWLGEPTPGAAITWPGTHTGLLVAPAGGGLWHTIEGNTGDGVRRRVRSLQGAVVIVPPELAGGAGLPPRLLYLEDVKAVPRFYGPWRSRGNRERVISKLPAGQRQRARRVRDRRGYGFWVGPRRVYGPWHTTEARDNAQAVLENRLGRRLRRFTKPTPVSAGAAEALGKTT